MADSVEEIQKAKKTYMLVFGALLVCTVLTVAVATVEALDIGGHGFDMWDCVLGLAIASFKATLVALIFMHLNHEKKAVYWIFGGGIVFAISLFGLTALAKGDPIFDPHFFNGTAKSFPAAEEAAPEAPAEEPSGAESEPES